MLSALTLAHACLHGRRKREQVTELPSLWGQITANAGSLFTEGGAMVDRYRERLKRCFIWSSDNRVDRKGEVNGKCQEVAQEAHGEAQTQKETQAYAVAASQALVHI